MSTKNTYLYYLFIAMFSFCMVACDDVFEEDLSGQSVTIIAPNANFVSNQNTVTFWWNEVSDAEFYRLQIVSEDFNNVTTLWLDTLVSDNNFNFTLAPGNYEWRIRPENFSSVGNYRTRKLTVNFNNDLSSELIQLSSPVNRDTSNQVKQLFSWNTLSAAEDYRIEVWSPTISGTMLYSEETVHDTIRFRLDEGGYEWRVRAQNEFTNSLYTTRALFIDTTSPANPGFLSPVNNAQLNNPVISFQWNRVNDNGSSIQDSIYIYSDSLRQTVVGNALSKTNTYQDSLGIGEYYWQVRSIDRAGNKSDYSTLQKFTIN